MKTTKRKRTGSVPQKGEPGYLTPTQLRNRRKRRAKKTQRQGSMSMAPLPLLSLSPSALVHDDPAAAEAETPTSKKATNKLIMTKDPSLKYIHNPIKAPIVQAAKNFFNTKLPEFRIHVGPLDGWRTVAKLAVRAASPSSSVTTANKKENSKPKVAIGLFVPHSHTLLPVPNCRAHHPSINRAVECIEKACHDVGVVPYQETSSKEHDNDANSTTGDYSSQEIDIGTGQLRYVAINVARESGAVQITLVWNASPPPLLDFKRKQHGVASIHDPVLRKLVSKLLTMSSVNISKNNPSNVNLNENDQKVATSTDDARTDTRPSCEGDTLPPNKKRRRRGRQEGKSATNAISNISQQSVNLISNTSNSKTLGKSEASNDTKHQKNYKLNLHSLWINYNQSWKHSNAIFAFDSTCWEHVYGPRAIIEHLNFDSNPTNGKIIEQRGLANPRPPSYSIPLHFPPNVFRQANLDAFTNIVGRIRERMQQQQFDNDDNSIACIELYGGVGTIGLHVSDVVTSLVSSDENPNNLACFYDSVRTLPADIQTRLVYKQLNAADMVTSQPELFWNCQVLIVDPPRRGLDIEVVNYLCKEGWKTMQLVVYVSCGFPALQRDCDLLLKSGRWEIEFAEGYLLFPGSDAIETLALFVPSKRK